MIHCRRARRPVCGEGPSALACDAGASDSPPVTAEKIGPRAAHPKQQARGRGCGYCTGLELSELNTWLTEETCAGHHAREFIDSAH